MCETKRRAGLWVAPPAVFVRGGYGGMNFTPGNQVEYCWRSASQCAHGCAAPLVRGIGRGTSAAEKQKAQSEHCSCSTLGLIRWA